MLMIKQKGQGLIEVVMTVVIISIALIALMRLQTNITHGNSVSQQYNTALLIGMTNIEALRDFSTLTGGAGSYQAIASGTSMFTDSNATYTITWTITPLTNPTYKVIDVTVAWTDRNGVNQFIRLISRIAGLDPAYSSTIMG